VGSLQAVGMAMVLCAIVVVQRPSRGNKVQTVIEPVD